MSKIFKNGNELLKSKLAFMLKRWWYVPMRTGFNLVRMRFSGGLL